MAAAAATAVLIASGVALRYDDGVMRQVVQNRVEWGHLPSGTNPDRCVALLTCDRLGDTVWLEAGLRLVPVTVCDCAARPHRAGLQRRGWAVDVAYGLRDLLPANVRIWSDYPHWRGLQVL